MHQKPDMPVFQPITTQESELHGIALLLHLVRQIQSDLVEVKGELREHIKQEEKQISDTINKLAHAAFPDGNMAGHKSAHESFIGDAADKRALFKSVREKTVTGIVYSTLIFVGLAIWEAIKRSIK